jgi:hypothetical protein
LFLGFGTSEARSGDITAYHEDDKTTGKPIRLFHGIADDWVPIAPCRDYVGWLKQAGADVGLAEYPDAVHAYDAFLLKEPLKLPQAVTGRNCVLKESDNGTILNAKTESAFSPEDPCIERGVQVAYNATAHQATVRAVKEFLSTTFKLE